MTLVMIAKYLPGGLFVHASCFKGATRSGRGLHHKGPPPRAAPRSIPSRPSQEWAPGAGAPAQPHLLRRQRPLSGSRGVPRSRGERSSSPRSKGRLRVPAAQVGGPHSPRPGSASLRVAAHAEPSAPSGESGRLRSRAPEQGHQRSLTCSGVSVLFPAAGSSPDRAGNAPPASVSAPDRRHHVPAAQAGRPRPPRLGSASLGVAAHSLMSEVPQPELVRGDVGAPLRAGGASHF
ncbi:hypothetical protein NDU88_002636 [Pleurodeles waltl]|uniref:Uncharacterized protein n=1 Tax=Pleurodeles waltl TaxID=8319 RepID=A0AAV7NE63_PLEWA|nr:hypothetical protein NDU88_002636 [Pleurodeles waltl]